MQPPTAQLNTTLWAKLRPYVCALLLLLVAEALMYAGDRSLVRYGFPWSLVSLLVIAATANLWGLRPALMVLVLSVLFSDFIVSDTHISILGINLPWQIRLIRALLFVACGGMLLGVTYEARRMRERAAQRREVVQALQRMVIPETLSPVPGFEIADHYQPAREEEEVGGDFYDVFPVDVALGRYGVIMGDVVGKGKEAAEHTALLRYSARAYAATGCGPAEILRQLNSLIESQQCLLGSASLFVGLLDAEAGALRYANAGHEPPILLRAQCEEMLMATGPLIGALEDARYDEAAIALAPGDSLLLFTDGVTEARDPAGRFLDEAGVLRLIRPLLSASVTGAVNGFSQRLAEFMAGRQRDDIAILLLRRRVPRPLHRLKTRLSAGQPRPTHRSPSSLVNTR